ncbi:MAG TPA: hypothetical protein VJB96_03120 [Patescibacteria group bacterium]|nr:hypothetical protein [Patescibacteria group bacterium]
MKAKTKIVLLIILLATGVVLGFMLRTPSSPISPQVPLAPQYQTQENEAGNVTVSVTPLFLKAGLPASFDVAFETHSVELDFDVEKVATLTDSRGSSYSAHWDGSPPGGHHRSGTLRFTPDLIAPTTITLTFTNIAGTPRTFTWEVQ